jgi:hypothetical protein
VQLIIYISPLIFFEKIKSRLATWAVICSRHGRENINSSTFLIGIIKGNFHLGETDEDEVVITYKWRGGGK